jgi:putative heme-binding domain-containing protein
LSSSTQATARPQSALEPAVKDIETLVVNDSKLKLPDDFQVELVAGNELVPNLYRLALSPDGELFVSGPGYIRKLLDRDGDGKSDEAIDFARAPRSGAQGLYCGPDFVLAIGDAGLLRFHDRNQDGIADGEPELLMKIGTGGEHLAHQIERGPDGWWYVIAGNQTPISPKFSAGAYSPVAMPRAGFLMRLAPNFSSSEVVAHGFRNAYDFCFNDRDEIFVYDSDDEREAGLPWYRPTRLFHVVEGDDAGYVNDGWKRPGYFFDMPTELCVTGRGSPTGVICYQSHQFPEDFDNAIFFADWTFGRIWVAKRGKSGTYGPPILFASTSGQFGFAVTDLLVDRQGALLVSVGGRGTAGGIYRIKFSKPAGDKRSQPMDKQDHSENLDQLQRLTRKRGPWDKRDWETIFDVLKKKQATLGRESKLHGQFLQTARQKALAALIGRGDEINSRRELHEPVASGIQASLAQFDPTCLKLVFRLGLQLDSQVLQKVDKAKLTFAGQMLLAHLLDDVGDRRMEMNAAILSHIVSSLTSSSPPSEAKLLACCRIGQMMLGDLGERPTDPALASFTLNEPVEVASEQNQNLSHGYASAIIQSTNLKYLDLTRELARSAALLNLSTPALQRSILELIDPQSDGIDDVHWLYCLSRTGPLEDSGLNALVPVLVGLSNKFSTQQIRVDRNWESRMQTLFRGLMSATPKLAIALLEKFEGQEDQIFWLGGFPPEQQTAAVEKLANRIARSPQQTCLKQLQAIFESRAPEYQSVFRLTVDQPQLQELSILALTRMPEEQDRERFRQGLLSRNLGLVKNSAIALRKLSGQADAEELIQAFRAMIGLGWNSQHVSVRDQLIQLIQTAGDSPASYQFKKPDLNQAAAVTEIGDWLQREFPDEFARLMPPKANWLSTFEKVDWTLGDAGRGRQIFVNLKCAQCHQGNSALGPSLEGVTKRFSRQDIFRLIGDPTNRISDRYRAKLVVTTDGETILGLPIYESVDGITLQDSSGQTIRIPSSDIEASRDSDQSLMPAGLLDELTPEQFADLEAFLRDL